MTMNETRQDAWRCAREQAALLLDNDLTHADVVDAAMTLAAAFRDIDPGPLAEYVPDVMHTHPQIEIKDMPGVADALAEVDKTLSFDLREGPERELYALRVLAESVRVQLIRQPFTFAELNVLVAATAELWDNADHDAAHEYLSARQMEVLDKAHALWCPAETSTS
jgi:hypothetical protein